MNIKLSIQIIDLLSSGRTEIFNKIAILNPAIPVKVGEVVNKFSRFTILGRKVQAVMCTDCNEIDANFSSTETINLAEYKAHLHVCSSPERKLHQAKVINLL